MIVGDDVTFGFNTPHYGEDTVYIMSYTKIPESTPAGLLYGFVAVGLIINFRTDIIVDSSITFISEEMRFFLKELVVGFNMNDDIEGLIDVVKKRYNVASLKAVCVALRDIDKKYKKWKLDNL